jgi:hypothetical protein
MNEIELKRRTKQFALRSIKLINALPKSIEGRAMQISWSGLQLLWQPITVLPVVGDQKPSLSRNWEQ